MSPHDQRTDTLQTAEPFSLWRFLNTPIYVFRRKHARPDWCMLLAAAELPLPAAQHVANVVRNSRLWSTEKRDITRELCAHFADGIAAGESPEQLIARFGDARKAAKLIRRAKHRARPAWWRTWRFLLKSGAIAFLLAVVVYAVLAAMFFLAKPNIARNYTAEINAPILARPANQNAWPVYMQALRKLGTVPAALNEQLKDADGRPLPTTAGEHADMWPQRVGDPRWPQAAAYIDSKSEALALVRTAAAMPALGYTLSDQIPRDYEQLTAQRAGTPLPSPAAPPNTNPELFAVLMPYLGEFRGLARTLTVDARRAVEMNDGERFVADVRAMLGMARQSEELESLINKLVQIAILQLTGEVVKDALSARILNADQLRILAHEFATFDDTILRTPLRLERKFLDDVVQRVYSDDGSGDGHMTSEGLRMLRLLSFGTIIGDARENSPLETALGPLSVPVIASRKEMLREADRFYALAEKQAATPLWQRTGSEIENETASLSENLIVRSRYILLAMLLPALDRAFDSCEVARQHRDAVLTALALESYRLNHGEYPPTLGSLVPSFLPRLPVDRYDGKTLKYALIVHGSEAAPIVYSVGVDRTDDGGFLPADAHSDPNMWRYKSPSAVQSLLIQPSSLHTYQGDWILYDPEGVAPRLPQSPPAPTAPAAAPVQDVH